MKNLKLHIATIVTGMLATHAVLATDSISADIARNYSDANWALINTASQPYQPGSRIFEDISSRYFDSNWIVISSNGKSHHALTVTPADIVITLKQ